jgi:hypothetical protein
MWSRYHKFFPELTVLIQNGDILSQQQKLSALVTGNISLLFIFPLYLLLLLLPVRV